MRIEAVRVTSAATVPEVAERIDEALRRTGAHEQAPVTFTDRPPDTFLEENPVVALAASHVGSAGGWAVRVYVWDRGETREVRLRALGDTRWGTLWNGVRGRAQLSAGRRVVGLVSASVRALDVGQR